MDVTILQFAPSPVVHVPDWDAVTTVCLDMDKFQKMEFPVWFKQLLEKQLGYYIL